MEEQMEPKRDEIGVRLDDGLQERVGAYAGREGLTVGEAIAALLYLGLEFAERQRTGLKEDIEDLQRDLRDLKQMVDVLGPAALGTQRILVHWAAQTFGFRRTNFWPKAGSSQTRNGRASSPSGGCSRPGRSRGSWRARWTASRSAASAPTTWPNAGSRIWPAAGSTRRERSCSSHSAPAFSRRARTPPGSPTSSGRMHFTRPLVTSRGWSCASSLSSPSGFRSLSLGP